MKRITLLILSFALCLACNSQNIYTRFIEKSSVSWAQDGTDTFRFASPNLSLLLRQQLNKEKIKAAVVEPGSSRIAAIRFVNKNDIIQTIAPNRDVQVVDGEGNNAGIVRDAEDPLFASKSFDQETNAKLEAAQIFYIECGRLKSYIPWVSPKYTITTSWGERLGIANAFSTSFGTSRSFSSRYKRRSEALGTHTRTMQMDSAGAAKMLKQLYGQNLVQALWPHLGKKYYQLRMPGSDVAIPISKINQTLIEESPVAVPVYDEEGNITTKGVILQESQPLDLTQITKIDIVQDWYYSSRNNRVYSTTRELVLYAIRSKAGVSAATASPILSIQVKE